MARTKTAPKTSEATAKKPAPAPSDSTPPANDGIRETVESVVVAFVLAFLFRTFEAEAFVIPTGSMAPTLMGRHKDVACENCGFPYRVTARDEVDEEGVPNGGRLISTLCPNCQYSTDLSSVRQQSKYPSFTGDRLLVGKLSYIIGEPSRWDVIVFKYPVRSQQNFIKRLVGLPGETIRIENGDIHVRPPGKQEFEVARKPPDKLQAMLQVVYDNDCIGKETLTGGVPPRWSGGESWLPSDDKRSFTTAGQEGETGWLRYTHFMSDWGPLRDNQNPVAHPDWIKDLNGYNMAYSETKWGHPKGPNSFPTFWVGDLAVECEAEIGGTGGELLMELVKGGVLFQCRIDLTNGEAKLSHTADPAFAATAKTHVTGKGIYRLAFSNVDSQLLLWVDGKPVAFDASTAYGRLNNTEPKEADRSPVGLAVRGVKAKVSHMRVLRDLYYIHNASQPRSADEPSGDDFPLAEDQFFVLGDNSAESLDARFWNLGGENVNFVHRDLLIGKALFIYWPHGWYEVPGTGIPFFVPVFDAPMFPNFARMGLVR